MSSNGTFEQAIDYVAKSYQGNKNQDFMRLLYNAADLYGVSVSTLASVIGSRCKSASEQREEKEIDATLDMSLGDWNAPTNGRIIIRHGDVSLGPCHTYDCKDWIFSFDGKNRHLIDVVGKTVVIDQCMSNGSMILVKPGSFQDDMLGNIFSNWFIGRFIQQ